MKQTKYVNYNVNSRIGYITLNRPDKRNALNTQLVSDLKEVFDFAENDNNAKVIVLKATGDAFCAGADLSNLKAMQTLSYNENLEDSRNLMELYKKIYTLKKVVVAQVEGHAIAGGAGLATVCDFVFSVPEAKFGYTEVGIGFVPAIVSVFIIRKIGEAKAKELLLTGKIISAQKAADMNIFNFIDKKDKIENSVFDFCQKLITRTSGDSLELTKKLIADIQSFDYENGLEHASKINAKSRSTDDCKKGVSAFLNKEKIVW